MIQLIVGNEGKGKTTKLLEKANQEITQVNGTIVYLDKNTKHMYELNNKIRLVDVSEFDFATTDEFYGFVCGILSTDHDLEQLYFDNFLRIASVKKDELPETLDKFASLSNRMNVTLYMSIAMDESELPEKYRTDVIVSL
ncbi:MAG: twitching motility protein PilT [Lachnospiraceae bacterium]|nr:twitching motility protein PilT [Lachnospiraceae bacterium]MDE6742599.1 twitching motility protein PilT [Lachnospiraceae bacterium]